MMKMKKTMMLPALLLAAALLLTGCTGVIPEISHSIAESSESSGKNSSSGGETSSSAAALWESLNGYWVDHAGNYFGFSAENGGYWLEEIPDEGISRTGMLNGEPGVKKDGGYVLLIAFDSETARYQLQVQDSTTFLLTDMTGAVHECCYFGSRAPAPVRPENSASDESRSSESSEESAQSSGQEGDGYTAAEVGELLQGYWTADGLLLIFGTEDHQTTFAEGAWFSEIYYQGVLADVNREEDGLYRLTIHCPAVEANELNDGHEEFDFNLFADLAEIADKKMVVWDAEKKQSFAMHFSGIDYDTAYEFEWGE